MLVPMITPEIAGLRFIALRHEGSVVTTWKAIQLSLDRFVDVHVVNTGAGTTPETAANFLAVARAVARLRHPGLAQIYDVVTDAPLPHVIAEHVEGATLAEMVADTGPLPPAVAARMARQVAEALDHAWTHARLVLRSLKPHNLRLNAQGQVKITDFSLAVLLHDGCDPTAFDGGHVVGTPHFIAPEQAQLSPALDFRADIYALGATLYFLVTAKVPFEGLDPDEVLRRQVVGQIPHPRTVNPRLPSPFCAVLSRMMMKNPENRHASWTEVIRDLKLLQSGRHVPRISRSPGGVSTIAPPPAAEPSSPPPPPATARASTLRFVLWTLLVLWFAWLANQRLGNPLGLPAAWAPSELRQPAPGSRKGRSGTMPPPSPALSPAATATMPSVESGAVASAGGAVPAPPPGGETTLPAELLVSLRQMLACGELAAARQALAAVADGAGAPAARAMLAALETLPDIAAQVERGILARRGQMIAIRYGGRERRVIPRSAVNGEIQAEFIAEDGTSRPVAFRIDRLDAAEKLRWLPPPATSAEHAAACLLALQAGDNASLARYAAGAGALAPLFKPDPPPAPNAGNNG
jgi:serine/threonine protein kinase